MFDLVFVLNSGFESIFAQKQSCRPFCPLQLLFWPNFKFLYGILSFNWSKSAKNHSISVNGDSPVLDSSPPSSTFASPRVSRRRSSRSAQTCRRVLIPFPGAVSVFPPLLLPHARGSSRARAEPSPAFPSAIPATPCRFPAPQAAPSHPASPPPLSRARATLCRAESTPAPPAAIAVSGEASPSPSTTTFRPSSGRFAPAVSFSVPPSCFPTPIPSFSCAGAAGTRPSRRR